MCCFEEICFRGFELCEKVEFPQNSTFLQTILNLYPIQKFGWFKLKIMPLCTMYTCTCSFKVTIRLWEDQMNGKSKDD